jgi:hypothetical protein
MPRNAVQGWRLQFSGIPSSIGGMKRDAQGHPPLERRFQRFLSRLVRHARDDLQQLPLHAQRRIHVLRVRMKKLGAILPLVKSRIPKSKYRAIKESAKRLKNAFDRQRDASVAQKLSSRLGVHTGRKANPPLHPVEPLFIEVAILERLVRESTFRDLRTEDVLNAYVKSYRKGRKRWKACRENPEPDLLHAWRKAVKKFFYQSLAFRKIKGSKDRIKRSKKLGKWLGHDHDWHLMAMRAEEDGYPNAVKLLGAKRRRIQKRIFRLAEKLYDKSPADLEKKLVKQFD